MINFPDNNPKKGRRTNDLFPVAPKPKGINDERNIINEKNKNISVLWSAYFLELNHLTI